MCWNVTLEMKFTELMGSIQEGMGKMKHGRITSEDGNGKEISQAMPPSAGNAGQDGWDQKTKQLMLRSWVE